MIHTHSLRQPPHTAKKVISFRQPLISNIILYGLVLFFLGPILIGFTSLQAPLLTIIGRTLALFLLYGLFAATFNRTEIWAYQNRLVLHHAPLPLSRLSVSLLKRPHDNTHYHFDVPINRIRRVHKIVTYHNSKGKSTDLAITTPLSPSHAPSHDCQRITSK